MIISRRILVFCMMAVLAEQILCAPLTKSDEVTPGIEDGTVESTTNERTPRKEIDDEDGAANYLKKFGYSNPGISKNSLGFRDELKESLKRMQKFFKLNVTGELDNDTLEVMKAPRCSLPDVITGAEGKQKRFTLFSKWFTNKLTYKINNYPSNSIGFNSKNEIDAAINDGLQIWTQYVNLIITNGTKADINLAFYKYDHGDGDSFDGKSGTLAHAFFPTDGRLHYDDSETWSNDARNYNLKAVTTHEVGHVLGLGHSNDYQSVMFPTYQYMTNFKLGDDDIKGIQYLYGAKVGMSPKAPITTTTTTTPRPWYKNFNFFWGRRRN